MDNKVLHDLYEKFQEVFPLERLPELTLEQYTNLNRDDSFTYWVETKTRSLGSIKGGSSYKFGIFRYYKITSQDNEKYSYDEQYAWYSRLGDNKDIVFDKIKDSIIKVTTYARNGDYDKIDEIKTLGDAFKWKIAFLYSNETLINIYDKELLINISNLLGGNFNHKSKISDLQKFLISKRNGKDIFEYGHELWEMREGQKTHHKALTDNNEDLEITENITDLTEVEDNPIAERKDFEKYTKEDFLKEVFLSEEELTELVNLIKHKQNIILQGAPGVGKTFTAKRLAYLIMGEKNSSRVEIVQFHQNFSYEDFIMGYKPTSEGGFELIEGKFIEFCKKAKENPQYDYFFIIDEINRGNLSKIFGELLMLIEKGYRGESIELAYNKKLFSVPKNLYLIGMMNTADRSLAMIDYALRRRFAFFPMSPGFDKESFRNEIAKSTDERVPKVIEAVKKLNAEIAKDDTLGDGFCIGHSYFCDPKSDKGWIENIVKYEIFPMLDEYWFDNKTKAEEEKKKLLEQLK